MNANRRIGCFRRIVGTVQTTQSHVHVFDREVIDRDYLGIGAVLDACACGARR